MKTDKKGQHVTQCNRHRAYTDLESQNGRQPFPDLIPYREKLQRSNNPDEKKAQCQNTADPFHDLFMAGLNGGDKRRPSNQQVVINERS